MSSAGIRARLRRVSSRSFGIRPADWLALGAVLALGLLAPEAASAQAQRAAPIRVSYQPATYWSPPLPGGDRAGVLGAGGPQA
jgi:hypothetical protein